MSKMFMKSNIILRNVLNNSKAVHLNVSTISQLQRKQFLSNAAKPQTQTMDPKSKDWEPIFKLRPIKLLVGLNKLKQYQALLTVCAIPVSMAFEASHAVEPGFTSMCAAIGTIFCLCYYNGSTKT